MQQGDQLRCGGWGPLVCARGKPAGSDADALPEGKTSFSLTIYRSAVLDPDVVFAQTHHTPSQWRSEKDAENISVLSSLCNHTSASYATLSAPARLRRPHKLRSTHSFIASLSRPSTSLYAHRRHSLLPAFPPRCKPSLAQPPDSPEKRHAATPPHQALPAQHHRPPPVYLLAQHLERRDDPHETCSQRHRARRHCHCLENDVFLRGEWPCGAEAQAGDEAKDGESQEGGLERHHGYPAWALEAWDKGREGGGRGGRGG